MNDWPPIVIMSYHHSGAPRLQLLLRDQIQVTCSNGTGILPLCHMGAETFQRIEDRQDRQLSRLAQVSLRSMATVLITAVLAEAGGRRWCELATVHAEAAGTFLKLFPGSRFVCVHRSRTDLISSGLQAHPWSIANAEFGPYPAAYPGNNAPALAAYWASHAQDLLAF